MAARKKPNKRNRPRKATKRPTRQPPVMTKSRAGARAGRGFRYQDFVGAVVLAEMATGIRPPGSVTPEGWDDIAVDSPEEIERIQVKRGRRRYSSTLRPRLASGER